jgi:hypothetical protein
MLRFCHFQLVNNARIQQTGLYSIGSKACGGPTGFVAYSKLNTTEFLTKLKNTQIIRKNSIRNGVITCDSLQGEGKADGLQAVAGARSAAGQGRGQLCIVA